MKTWRSFRTAAAASALFLAAFCFAPLCFLFFVPSALSQERPPNGPSLSSPQFSTQPSAEEKLLLDAANRERSAAGLQPLRWDNALAAAARQHAQTMASQNLVLHQCLDEPPVDQRAAQAGAKFSMIAENIAVGPNPETIHNGWMHSTGHRKNILNADVTAVGIAAIRGSGGLFAVQDFSRPVADLSLEQQEDKVISLLKGTGVVDANATEDARRACGKDRGFAGASALYVMRFEVTDLGKLPDDLLRNIKSRAYRKASVGACEAGDSAGFTRYRLAVLLY
jgi:uncharacterized protein YkwD